MLITRWYSIKIYTGRKNRSRTFSPIYGQNPLDKRGIMGYRDGERFISRKQHGELTRLDWDEFDRAAFGRP